MYMTIRRVQAVKASRGQSFGVRGLTEDISWCSRKMANHSTSHALPYLNLAILRADFQFYPEGKSPLIASCISIIKIVTGHGENIPNMRYCLMAKLTSLLRISISIRT